MKKMKVLLPFAVVGLMLSLGACGGPGGGESGNSTTSSAQQLPKIKVTTADDKTSLTLIVGETGQVKADQEGVTWASTNTAVATVENGVVKAVAPGSAKITASKDGFRTGDLNVTVNRKPPIATLHMEDADHNAADGFWYNSRGPELTPVYEKSAASDGTCIGYFGEGDVEVLKFTSSAAIKAELVLTMGHNNSFEPLSEIMDAKLNNVAIDLSAKNYVTDSDGQGGYTFQAISLGEFDLVNGENALEFDMKGNAPYLDDLMIYSEAAATIAKVDAPAKETIVLTNAEGDFAIETTDTVQITSATTGLSYHSRSENIAVVDENGLVTGVAEGSAVIEVYKAGMISAKANITVTRKAAAGEINVEAETGVSSKDESGADQITFRNASGGHNSTDAFPSGATLTINVEATNAGSYTMTFLARRSRNQGEFDNKFATAFEMKINDAAVATEAAVDGTSWADYVIANVTLKAGANTLTIKALTEVNPINIDSLRFTPVA